MDFSPTKKNSTILSLTLIENSIQLFYVFKT